MAPDYFELSVDEFLGRVSEATAAPGAGPVAATVVALAAGLTAMAAGLSRRHLPEAEELAGRALELQELVKPLAKRDADVYADVLRAQARPADDPERADAVRAALSAAADVPLEMATVGMEVLEAAEKVARQGNPSLRGDAVTACLLAQAAVHATAGLVELNLSDPEDPRRVRAAELRVASRSTQFSLSAPS